MMSSGPRASKIATGSRKYTEQMSRYIAKAHPNADRRTLRCTTAAYTAKSTHETVNVALLAAAAVRMVQGFHRKSVEMVEGEMGRACFDFFSTWSAILRASQQESRSARINGSTTTACRGLMVSRARINSGGECTADPACMGDCGRPARALQAGTHRSEQHSNKLTTIG